MREAAGGVVVEVVAPRCPVDEIVEAFNAVAPAAGLPTLPLGYGDAVRDIVRPVWLEVPNLSIWLEAFAMLPGARHALSHKAKVRTFRQLLDTPPFDKGRRNIWRVLERELIDTPDEAPASRVRDAKQSDAELYPWRHGNPEGWVEQPQVSIDDEDMWA